jgi:hypothetical protein
MPENFVGISLFAVFSFALCVCLICFICLKTSAAASQPQYLPQYVPVATAVDPGSGHYPSAPPMPINPAYVPPAAGYGGAGGGGGGFWTGMGTGGMVGYMLGRR